MLPWSGRGGKKRKSEDLSHQYHHHRPPTHPNPWRLCFPDFERRRSARKQKPERKQSVLLKKQIVSVLDKRKNSVRWKDEKRRKVMQRRKKWLV